MISKTIAVRPLADGDLHVVATLSAQLGYPTSADDLRRRWRTIQQLQGSQSLVLVAEAGGVVVGWIQATLRALLEAELGAEIVGLVVEEHWRGRGIGRHLTDAVEVWARAKGCRSLRVRSRIEREGAHRFYERAGYIPLKTQRVFEKAL